jgi:hypothetical protein
MARRARASGMPTAQPIITPRLEGEDEEEEEPEDPEDEEVCAGAMMEVMTRVDTPAEPEETEVWSVVLMAVAVGSVLAAVMVVDLSSLVAVDEEPSPVDEGEEPDEPDVAIPVIVARFGADDAVDEPMVA